MSQANSIYSIAAHLNGGGIGRIARFATLGINRAGLLKQLACQGIEDGLLPENIVDSHRFRMPRRLLNPLSDRAFYLLKNRDFDRWLEPRMDSGCRVFHGWTAQTPNTLKKAVHMGCRTILTRGSTHILTQARLLAKARQEVGLDRESIYRKVVISCLEEYQTADLIVVPGDFVLDTFKKEGHGRDNIVSIPWGVDHARCNPRMFEDMDKRPEGPPRLLFIGQVALRKGIVTLLKAAKILAGRNRDFRLNIVGSMDAEAQSVLKGIDFPTDKVRFLGYISHPEGYLRVSDIFVFPTYEEGSALVTYEAMSCGTPMITTQNAGSLARHGQEALIVPIGDAPALADSIEHLIGDPDLALKLSLNAKQRIQPYTWDLYGDRIALLHKMAAQNASPSEIQQAVDKLNNI